MLKLRNVPYLYRKSVAHLRHTWVATRTNGRLERPVFIVGCGRSGTTILGKCLSTHPEITYLNEPRQLWRQAFVATDYLSWYAWRNGTHKFDMYEDDASPYGQQRLERLLAHETVRHGGRQLVEKTPINSMRMRFIMALFPDARFIHICRNPLEVARSIAENVELTEGTWWGGGQIKLHHIRRYATMMLGLEDVVKACKDDYDLGLLEWRVYTTTARQHLQQLPPDRAIELTYDQLIDQGEATIARLLDFMNVAQAETTLSFARDQLVRRKPRLAASDASEHHRFIAGPLLDAYFAELTTSV